MNEQEKQKQNHCHKCGKILVWDEVAITKKMINRGTKKYYCVECLSKIFDVETKDILDKIQFFKEMGCTLFL